MTNCIQSYQIDDDEVTIPDEDVRFSGVVVRAHVEWQDRMVGLASSTMLSHAICDSGADSCVVGRMAKVTAITGRTANLVGYDPQTTKSGHLPIVTALLKTVSADNVPLLLCVNEAVYNQHSPITLLAEYQMREFGLIVDSVATKHYTAPNVPGTQTLYVSDIVKCPMVDRGVLWH